MFLCIGTYIYIHFRYIDINTHILVLSAKYCVSYLNWQLYSHIDGTAMGSHVSLVMQIDDNDVLSISCVFYKRYGSGTFILGAVFLCLFFSTFFILLFSFLFCFLFCLFFFLSGSSSANHTVKSLLITYSRNDPVSGSHA